MTDDVDDAQIVAPNGHVGRHHRASCGEWRPVASNDLCPRCPEICPECGSRYYRGGGDG